MSQRNPMNERYTEERTGKTRKSAASAKPATKAASSVRVQGAKQEKPKGFFARAAAKANQNEAQKASDKAKKRDAREDRFAYREPDNPEYQKWRRIWWGLIILALVLTAGSMFLLNGVGSQAGMITLGAGYIALAAAIVVDLRKVRRLRDRTYMENRSDRSKEATRTRKQQKAERKQREAEMVEEAQRKEEEKESRKQSRKLFGRKSEQSDGQATQDEAAE